MEKIYYLYQIVNKTNGHIYIGVHETFNLNDGYFGSGKALKLDIKECGKENFEKTILKFFDSQENMYQEEAKIVTFDFILREDTYNLIPGGKGSWGVNGIRRLGTTWITNGEEELVIKKGDFIPDGWDYGRSRKSSKECFDWYLSLEKNIRHQMAQHARRIQQVKYDNDSKYLDTILEKRERTRKANQIKNGYKQRALMSKEERSIIAKRNRAIQQAKFDSDPKYRAEVLAKRETTRKANQLKNGYKQKPKGT
jgi:GIY-YIG catalytic domain